jgi:membrane-associated protease RseP (regulator of RpoE activity)
MGMAGRNYERSAAPTGTATRPTRWSLHIGLFVLTVFTTSLAGALNAGADVFADWTTIVAGLPFSLTLMGILLVHEMGHYTLARHHGVGATLPFFIPAPPPFPVGTFGAFIRMDTPPESRRALFDVGAAGPWAGLVAAIPAIVIGLQWSRIEPRGLMQAGLELGEPLLFRILSYLTLGPVGDNMTIVLHPVALAGWFGLFVTFLNLLPIGQLDGGHVAYAMFGRRHRLVARAFVLVILVLAFYGWSGWFVWVGLVGLLGIDHPPTLDAWVGLDRRRQVAGWLTIAVFGLTFMPTPISVVEPSPVFEGEVTPVSAPASRGSRAGESPGLPIRIKDGYACPA